MVKRFSLLIAVVLFLSSCVLEERYHFNKDMSGIHEISFGMKSMDGEEAREIEDSTSIIEYRQVVSDVDGVELLESNFSESQMSISLKFDNIESLNLFNNEIDGVEEQRNTGQFGWDKKRLSFDQEVLKVKNKDLDKEKLREVFEHRIVVTFDKKIKGLKQTGFKKLDKHTLVYDSTKQPTVNKVSFSLKLK